MIINIFLYIFLTITTDLNSSNENDSDKKNNKLQSFADKLNISLLDKHLKKSILHEVKEKLNDMNDCENKTLKLIVERIISFERENNFIKEQNKKIKVDLKTFKASLKTAQKNIKSLKENYSMLQINNKNILAKLNNIKDLRKSVEVDHSEDKRKKKLTKEDSDQLYRKNKINGFFTVNSLV